MPEEGTGSQVSDVFPVKATCLFRAVCPAAVGVSPALPASRATPLFFEDKTLRGFICSWVGSWERVTCGDIFTSFTYTQKICPVSASGLLGAMKTVPSGSSSIRRVWAIFFLLNLGGHQVFELFSNTQWRWSL